MISEKQRKANRENAKKSTGPRTAEGKARSSKNGIKHGLLARDAVMADEDQAEYDRSFQELEENLFPKNNIEFRLVRQIADADWRLLRLTRIEAGLIMQAYNSTSRFDRKHYPDSILPGRDGENQLLGKGMQDHMPSLATLARYRTQANRDMMRCLKMIRQLRADEAACGENLSWNGATHRPIPTDPDPYNTPDPMQPQPERYEPPAEPAETAQTSDPIGFRAKHSIRDQRPSEIRITIHESRFTDHGSRITPEFQKTYSKPKPLETKGFEPGRSHSDQLRNPQDAPGATSEPSGNGGNEELTATNSPKQRRG